MRDIELLWINQNNEYQNTQTSINGTDREIVSYYLDKFFNLGSVTDDMYKCVGIKFHDTGEFLVSEQDYNFGFNGIYEAEIRAIKELDMETFLRHEGDAVKYKLDNEELTND